MSDMTAVISADDVGRAVHDVASPMTVLVGLCFALRRRADDSAMLADIGRVEREIERISDRLEALANLARPVRSRHVWGAVRLAALARDVVSRSVASAQRAGVNIQVQLCDRDLVIDGDTRTLEAALENLVGNAVRHAGDGGTVWVSASAWGAQAVVHVADDGPGVHPDDRPHIFHPHVRGRDAKGFGQGLGLAIARDTARDHGGDLILEPSPRGAVFRLALPLAIQLSELSERGAA
jgi:signal transduction histidine kinase